MTRGNAAAQSRKTIKAPSQPVTREEQIAHEIEQLCRNRFERTEIELPTWHVDIGQKVVMGGLVDPIVVEKHDFGRVIVLEYTQLESRTKKPIGRAWIARWWFDVFPISDYKEPQFARRISWNRYFQSSVDGILYRICEESFRDNPDYQREYVWTHEDELRFIEAIFSGRELGRFIFVKYRYPDVYTEVLDGKQRLNTIKEFVLGKWPFRDRYWWQYSPADRQIFESQPIQYAELDATRYTRSDLLNIFLEVNAGGVPQSEDHLNKVRELYQKACEDEAKRRSP